MHPTYHNMPSQFTVIIIIKQTDDYDEDEDGPDDVSENIIYFYT